MSEIEVCKKKPCRRDANLRNPAYESASLSTRPSSCTAVTEGDICQTSLPTICPVSKSQLNFVHCTYLCVAQQEE
ncbi:hypothetical protein Y032_0522g2895 [Ancylostoma ceylanicum]|uniref:Uncharacterized protein n=1 Tax=Ancylostoma ceylanicum TaxID=53326 RepID=A0A016WSP7_9BILA|nr:hypothetical protein Y032_0522g2895 [Ancylostoma ceylanicum]